jgi:hypothetical protein
MLGQGGRDGGDPAGRAAEVNAGPALFPSYPQGAAERRIILKTAPSVLIPTSRMFELYGERTSRSVLASVAPQTDRRSVLLK